MDMTKLPTLEEAIKAERKLQEEMEILRRSYTASKKPETKYMMNRIKADLEWLNGYVVYGWKKDKDGNRILDESGFPIRDKDNIIERKDGYIQLLSKRAQRLKERSNLGKRFSDRTFENFDIGRDKNAYEKAVLYAQREDLFDNKQNCMLIIGSVGTGKTHLAAAISNRLIENGIPTLFGTFSEHLQKIKEEFDNDSTRVYLRKMQTTPMLVLDDLGKERKSDWSQQVLFDVVNYRYEHLLPMIITTTLSNTDLYNYVSQDVVSRLNEMNVAIHTNDKAGDYRINGKGF